ncbi:Fork-head domain-containing protein [Aphelenchoides fujianensis]|nr:Fork-head domain-containing protein [Aphelenchoides fujianensis]
MAPVSSTQFAGGSLNADSGKCNRSRVPPRDPPTTSTTRQSSTRTSALFVMSSLMGFEQTHPTANGAPNGRLLPCSSGAGPTCSSDDSGHSTDSQMVGMNPQFEHGRYGNGLDEDFEPQARDRCNTWPMRRPNLEPQSATSPLIHERIPEEGSLYGSEDNLNEMAAGQPPPLLAALQPPASEQMTPLAETPSPGQYGNDLSPGDLGEFGGSDSPPSSKKSTTRRNAWGNMSYADLITQAILSAPEKRLTLAQVYEWMTANVPYFADKADSSSSSGWKVG